jgi:hypothetical protein
VQFGEFGATLAITGAATPVTAIETDEVDGDKNCGRLRDADEDDAEVPAAGNVIATVPRSSDCAETPPDEAPPPEHEASKRPPSAAPTPIREIAKRT